MLSHIPVISTARKESKYVVFAGPYGLNTGKYGPEKSLYLMSFHAVTQLKSQIANEHSC